MNVKSYIKSFGLKIFLVKAIRKPFYNNYSYLSKKLSLYNEKVIKEFLYKNVIQDLKKVKSQSIQPINKYIKKNSVIWTMWWQGLNDAPSIVKACIRELRKNNPTRDVIVITKENYQKYVHVDSKIITNLNNGSISITHFSDVYRVNLLYIYGGVWVDSTILSTKTISDNIFNKDFFTIKTGKYTNDPSHGRWTTFFLESKAGNELMNFLRLSFDLYSNKYNLFIDYILFDYLINIAYENSRKIMQEIKNVPKNNENVFKLTSFLNTDISQVQPILTSSNTYMYKLTYKMNFIDSPNTLYNQIISGREFK
ncbi:capsular polysaccharide synthesis protein [Lactobacillus gallinarum]|uniref:capsular polysaccharide synthesis protein n=1 Tax=Lactobacillus gallinarum TaxID=52242 RepID=UPI000B37E627|nr:capsular polysaccharide synthesis protein [Lactobacillus gallinarum]OUQ00226.1 hypothetical protein B5E95_06650 [Lactobacillus gallinarum]